MKKIIIPVFLLLPFSILAQTFTIQGKIGRTNPKVTKVVLYYAINGQNVLDSVDVRNGAYTFQGRVSGPTRADILAKYNNSRIEPRMSRDLKTIFIEPGNMTISSSDSFSNATITGSRSNVEFERIQNLARPYLRQAQQLSSQVDVTRRNNRHGESNRLQSQLDAINNNIKENVYKKYFQDNKNSPIALFALQQYAGAQVDNPQEALSLFETLPQPVKMSTEGKRFLQLINFTSRSGVGKEAPGFTQNDVNGRPVSLSNYRGKYVLINFWASWCASCRAETYTIKKLDSLYGRNNNFKIISVSLDKPGERNLWLDAVKKDGMTWTNVSDLRFWNNEVAVRYGVSLLPQNILIDKNGKIVARNVRGEQLEERVRQLLR